MAKRSCVPCIGAELKEIIGEDFPGLTAYLSRVPDCPIQTEIQLCYLEASKKRSGRKTSEYNRFIGTCMKEGNVHGRHEAASRMKTCAAQWRSGAAPPPPETGSVPAGAAV